MGSKMGEKTTVRSIKLREFTTINKVTVQEIREAMYYYYYPNSEFDDSRELIITKCLNNYGDCSTIVLSNNGSPPKGECILLNNGCGRWSLIFIGNGRMSTMVSNMYVYGLERRGDENK